MFILIGMFLYCCIGASIYIWAQSQFLKGNNVLKNPDELTDWGYFQYPLGIIITFVYVMILWPMTLKIKIWRDK